MIVVAIVATKIKLHTNLEEQYRGLMNDQTHMSLVIQGIIDDNNRALGANMGDVSEEDEPAGEEESLFGNP